MQTISESGPINRHYISKINFRSGDYEYGSICQSNLPGGTVILPVYQNTELQELQINIEYEGVKLQDDVDHETKEREKLLLIGILRERGDQAGTRIIYSSYFIVSLEKPVWSGIKWIAEQSPYVLPHLISDLESLKGETCGMRIEILDYAIEGIRKFIK